MNKNDRCKWAKNDIYIEYHDNVWGKKMDDEAKMFELFILETQSVGLSFWQIYAKKDEYNKYFDFKNPKNNINISNHQIESLLSNSKLIKNKNKLLSIIENSKAYLKLKQDYNSFSNFIWNNPEWLNQIGKTNYETTIKNETSNKICKILKQYGFKFIGSITIFSYLQAIGFYNDHQKCCKFYKNK